MTAKRNKPAPKLPAKHVPMETIVAEVFRLPWSLRSDLRDSQEPSSFNGTVEVRRYRVTVEEIPEPDDVIAARLTKLWEECANHHHWRPLRHEAAKIGLELPMETFGKNRMPR